MPHLGSVAHDIVPVDRGRAACGRKKRDEHLDRRGFARAVRTQERENLSSLDCERYIVNRGEVLEPLHEMCDLNDGGGCRHDGSSILAATRRRRRA